MTHVRSTDVGCAEAIDVGSVDAIDVGSAEASDVGSAESTDVGSADAADVGSAEATYVTSTEAATSAAGLRARGNKAAGDQRGCQSHHPSSFHDLSPLEWAGVPPQDLQLALARANGANVDVVMDSKVGILA
jgi:hypothetical protein